MALDATRHPRRFTVEEYYRMAKVGILDEDDRVELLDGEIVVMSPIGPPHAYVVKCVNRAFSRRVGDLAIVSVQDPIRLNDQAEPEPDLALLRPPVSRYARAHPGPADVLLIVEVAETSAAHDRRVKLDMYARAGIPEVWLLNLTGKGGHQESDSGEPVLEAYRDPTQRGYTTIRLFRRGDRVSPQALPNLDVTVDELLGEDADEPAK